MKVIPLTDRDQFKVREIIKQIAMTPPQGAGLNFDQVNKRCRIIDALEKQQGELLRLEDADWQTLCSAIDVFPFGMAHPDLRDIVQSIKDARDVVTAVPDDHVTAR